MSTGDDKVILPEHLVAARAHCHNYVTGYANLGDMLGASIPFDDAIMLSVDDVEKQRFERDQRNARFNNPAAPQVLIKPLEIVWQAISRTQGSDLCSIRAKLGELIDEAQHG